MDYFKDTIASISTPLMSGGIGIIRISGPYAKAVADRIFTARNGKISELEGYRALYGRIMDDGEKIDDCVAVNYNSPHSYTGEDVVELSCHGGIFLLRRVLSLAIKNGARPAEPGEFTRRAFLNGKIDLSQAEAVMDIISAKNMQALRAANAMKDGALTRRINAVRAKLTETAAHLSAWIDFPDDDIPQVEMDEIKSGIEKARDDITALIDGYDNGVIMREGISTVIAGRPNAGKSTIMNMLSGREKSIVTEIEGTTRDVIENTVTADGIMLRLADTAGIRNTGDIVEQLGVKKAKELIETAGLILAVFDASRPLCQDDIDMCSMCEGRTAVAVINKTDIAQDIDIGYIKHRFAYTAEICAKTGEGSDRLIETIKEAVDYAEPDVSSGMLATQRQKNCAERALAALEETIAEINAGQTPDVVCVLLDEALSALLEMSGELVTDTIADEIFNKFCIGK